MMRILIAVAFLGWSSSAQASEPATEPLPTGSHLQKPGDFTVLEAIEGTQLHEISWDVVATVMTGKEMSTVASTCAIAEDSLVCPGLGSTPVVYSGTVNGLDLYSVSLDVWSEGSPMDGGTTITVEPSNSENAGGVWGGCKLQEDDDPECNSFCQGRNGDSCTGTATTVNIGGCDLITCTCICPTKEVKPFMKVDYDEDNPCHGSSCTPQPECCTP